MDDLPLEDAKELLRASRLGSLALAADGHAYAIPMFFAFDGHNVYFQCHPGEKDRFIDQTKQSCLTVIHMESEHIWESVQVFGPVQRLHLSDDLDEAKSALLRVPFPPARGSYPGGLPIRTSQLMFYMRLTPKKIAGMRSDISMRVET